VARWRSFCAYS